jgi:outer membrane receptor protein involved in Fe transport
MYLSVQCLAVQQTSPPSLAASSYAGISLTEALLDLRARGLKIVFTTNVVQAQMRVEATPQASDLKALLFELLEPHALIAVEGPDDTLVVVPRPRGHGELKASIVGTVHSRADATPVAGVLVRLLDSNTEVSTATDGNFSITDLNPGTFSLEIRRRGFVVEKLSGITVVSGQPTELAILLDAAPLTEDVVTITPSRVSLLRQDPVAPTALSRDEILSLPHLGDDFFRALSLLPGISGNDVSAEFHVRGGRRDETQILLDGQELYETYHLKDFDSALSIVAPATLASVDLSTGGFSAQHGDRMSGVLDMTTQTPTGRNRTLLGLSVLSVHAGSSGTFSHQRGSWITQVRRGSTDLVGELLGNQKTQYWDGFGKLDYQLNLQNSLRVNFLMADDEFKEDELLEDSEKHTRTAYLSAYLWFTLQTILSADLFTETAVSTSRISRDRQGFEIDEEVEINIRDIRDLDVLEVRQAWILQATPRQYLKWGFDLRDFDATYDYDALHRFNNPLALLRRDPDAETTTFAGGFRERHDSAHLANQLQIGGPTTLELGLRLDRHTQTDERLLSPRFNLARALGRSSVLRAAWGRFNQSQRPYELQVEDGETDFHPVEKSEHRVVGFEHHFESMTEGSGLDLRVEIYQRRVKNPRARYENLYEPINTFQEVEPDRVRIAPGRSLAEGFEVFLHGTLGQRTGWWVNYVNSSTEDEIAGRWFKRRFDQTHSLNLDLNYRVNDSWTVNLAWRYHTGWPTTALSLEEVLVDGEEDEEPEIELVPVLGPRFAERLPTYHRLDVRASRTWTAGARSMVFFVDIQNAYDRGNISGFDFEVDEDAGLLITNRERWAGILPSVGISIGF